MNTSIPNQVKIYHIVHINNLPSIIADGYLFSDSEMRKKPNDGIVIGMNRIKERRLKLQVTSHRNLAVGECVPFYFCPRSIMLYIIHMRNSADIEYHGGQAPILHLAADFYKAIEWVESNKLRWAFTTSNAGAYYFDDYADISELDRIDWQAVQTNQWSDRDIKEKKQAEFLVEQHFPWELVEEIGVYSQRELEQVNTIIGSRLKNIRVTIQKSWYY